MENVKIKKRISITLAFIGIWLFNISIYFFFLRIGIPRQYFPIIIFFISLLIFISWLFFFIKIEWLRDTQTGRELMYLNISNILSVLRFTIVPFLIALFGIATKHNLSIKIKLIIAIFALIICLTDLIDGILARKLNQVTLLGKVIDPAGDFLMILSFAILIYTKGIITWWFFSLLLIRIPLMSLIAIYIVARKIRFKPKTTAMGKTTIFYSLTLLGVGALKLLLNIKNIYFDNFMYITQIIGALIILISSFEKIVFFEKIIHTHFSNSTINKKIKDKG